MANHNIMREFWHFCKHRKKMWMLPLCVILAALGFVVAYAGLLSPFIYPL